jgi:sec-independent protein translocase protein TatA
MLRQLGPTELLIILGIVILLFGVGRLSKIGSELGQGIRAFKEGIKSDESAETVETAEQEAAE